MTGVYLTITTETLCQAISDLATRADDIHQGTQSSSIDFKSLIGSPDHPDITPQAQVERLDAVRQELMQAMEDIEKDAPTDELSDDAILVLTCYKGSTARPRLNVEHVVFGEKISSAHLLHAAELARDNLLVIHDVIEHNLEPPEQTYYEYFVSYEDEIGAEEFDAEDDFWLLGASIAYLETIIESPNLAWEGKIKIPEIMRDHILLPALEYSQENMVLM